MVHYGPLSGNGGAGGGGVVGLGGLQLNGLVDAEPLNYMRANGAALLVAAGDLVDQQQQQLQLQQQQSSSAATMATTVSGKARNQFYCDQCNMAFGSKSAHTSHMKSHQKYAATAPTSSPSTSMVDTAGNEDEAERSLMQGSNFSGAAGVLPNVGGGGGGGDPYQCDKCNKTFAVPARLVSGKLRLLLLHGKVEKGRKKSWKNPECYYHRMRGE